MSLCFAVLQGHYFRNNRETLQTLRKFGLDRIEVWGISGLVPWHFHCSSARQSSLLITSKILLLFFGQTLNICSKQGQKKLKILTRHSGN